jgi:hypothetical protein
MKSFLSFLLLVCSLAATAQVPEPHMFSLQVIGGSGGDHIDPFVNRTPDGGFIIALSTNSSVGPAADSFCESPPGGRAIFMKYSADGSVREWFKCRKSSWGDTGYIFMFQTVDDKYILGAVAHSGNKWVIRKEDAAGNALWTKAYGGSGSQMLYSMMQADDGGYVLFGSAYSGDGDIGFHYGSAGIRDFWVLKVDANGDKVWSRVYGGTAEDIGATVLAAPGGGYYIIGSSNSADYECTGNHGLGDVFIARLTVGGDMLWHRCLGGSGSDGGEVEGCRATLDGNGGVLIAAKTGSADGDVGHKINITGDNFWVLNVDSSGTLLWDNCYGGGGAEIPSSICKATDGSIWIMGKSRLAGGQVNAAYGAASDAYVVHTDAEGNFLNAKVLGSSGQDVGYMIYPLSDGLVLGGGYYSAGNGIFPPVHYVGPDAFLVKLTNWANEIQVIPSQGQFSIYPNPAREAVNIETVGNSPSKIAVNDVMGRLLYNSTLANSIRIPVNDWQSGVYYVQVINERGYKEVQKLIVH